MAGGEFSVRADEKYHAVLEEAQRIHSVAWYISMITDDYISLDEELQELEKQREFEAAQTVPSGISASSRYMPSMFFINYQKDRYFLYK